MPPKLDKSEPVWSLPRGSGARGRGIFDDHCSVCHALDHDDDMAVAPPLRGILGRNVGSARFPYSKSMKQQTFKWNEKHMFFFLKNPKKYIAGTRMRYEGMKNDNDIADLIQYLKDN